MSLLHQCQIKYIIPVLEISSSLVSINADEGNEGSTAPLTWECAPGGADLPGDDVIGGPDFSGDADPIKSKTFRLGWAYTNLRLF